MQGIRHSKLLCFITSRNKGLNTTHCFANAASGIWPKNKNKIKKYEKSCWDIMVSPHVKENLRQSWILDSRFFFNGTSVDYGFQSLLRSGLVELYSGLQSPGFRIPQEKFPDSRFHKKKFSDSGFHEQKFSRLFYSCHGIALKKDNLFISVLILLESQLSFHNNMRHESLKKRRGNGVLARITEEHTTEWLVDRL